MTAPLLVRFVRRVVPAPLRDAIGVGRWIAERDLRRRAADLGRKIKHHSDGTVSVLTRSAGGAPARAVRLGRHQAPYFSEMVTNFDFYHGSVVPSDEDGVEVVDFSRPARHTLRASGERFWFSGFAEDTAPIAIYLAHAQLRPGDVVIDAGAYCGVSTVAFSRAVGPTGHVLALEPDPGSVAMLRRNLAEHGATNVTVVEAALWRDATPLAFSADGNLGSGTEALLARGTAVREVAAITLGDAFARATAAAPGRPLACLKIDIEGAEVAVLDAGGDVLRAHRPRVIVEPHADPERPGTLNTDSVVGLLARAGYTSALAPQGYGDVPLVLAAPGQP